MNKEKINDDVCVDFLLNKCVEDNSNRNIYLYIIKKLLNSNIGWYRGYTCANALNSENNNFKGGVQYGVE